MRVPVVLLLVSLAGVMAALGAPGLSDLVLLAGPCALASLILLVRAALRPRTMAMPSARKTEWPTPKAGLPARKTAGSAPKWIVVDGSNVMHWKDGIPKIETLHEVLAYLTGLGYSPGVVFDANAGYLVSGRYQHHGSFGAMLGLPEDRVMVVPKGSPADATVLAAARDLRARIVTNDRYRDWAEQHPEVRDPGYLIRGGYRDGKLWLDVVGVAA